MTTYSSGEEDEEDSGRAYVKTAVDAPLTDAGASAVCVDGGADDEIRQRGDDVDEDDDDAHVDEKKTVRPGGAKARKARNDIRFLRLNTRKPTARNTPEALKRLGWTVGSEPNTMKPLRALMQVLRAKPPPIHVFFI